MSPRAKAQAQQPAVPPCVHAWDGIPEELTHKCPRCGGRVPSCVTCGGTGEYVVCMAATCSLCGVRAMDVPPPPEAS